MNAATIPRLATVTSGGAMPVPEIIGRLIDKGVESPLVDDRASFPILRGQRVGSLGRQGDPHVGWFAGAAPTDA